MSYLARVFAATTAAVHDALLATAEPRPRGKLLDLGCDDGALTAVLARHVGTAEAHGIESRADAAELARERRVQAIVGDVCAPFPYPDETFDVVLANQVIEHLPCTDRFMSEIRRVLRPDGYALVCTNNLASWHNVLALVLGAQPLPCHVSDEFSAGALTLDWRGSEHEFAHLRVFTARALIALADHHGLQTEREVGVGYYPLPNHPARLFARVDRRHAAYVLLRLCRSKNSRRSHVA